MEKLTRRKLIKQASLGAGAVGVLATAAACASPNEAQSTQSAQSAQSAPLSIPADPLAVFVTDPARGTLVIMRGNREFIVTNPTLAQSLLALQ